MTGVQTCALPIYISEMHFTILVHNLLNAPDTMRQFVPAEYLGDLLVLYTGEPSETFKQQITEKWRPYIKGSIQAHYISGSHEDMMRPVPLAEIGTHFASALRTL